MDLYIFFSSLACLSLLCIREEEKNEKFKKRRKKKKEEQKKLNFKHSRVKKIISFKASLDQERTKQTENRFQSNFLIYSS